MEIAPSWVRVRRLSYDEVEARLEEEPFRGLHELAERHQARRRANGAIFIDLPEVKMRVSDGQVDINNDGSITTADDGTFAGYSVYDGLIDTSGNGSAGGDANAFSIFNTTGTGSVGISAYASAGAGGQGRVGRGGPKPPGARRSASPG